MLLRIAASVLAFTLTLSLFACGTHPDGISGESKDGSTAISNDTPFPDMILTKEEMLEDFDAIWKAFQENTPFLGLIERQHRPDFLVTVIAENRRRIMEMEAAGDDAMLEFIIIIAESMSEACDIDRHAGIQNSSRFFADQVAFRGLIDEQPALQPWLDMLEDKNISAFYEYYDYLIERMMNSSEGAASSEAEDQESQQEPEGENLKLIILEEEKTAYIKADSFDTEFMGRDIPKIRAFLEEVKDYEHLIIDIQNNGGGNAAYWEEAFVRPNISEPVTTTFVRLMRNGDLAKKFYGIQYEDTTLTVEDVKNDPAFTALRKEDIDKLAYAREYFDTTEPESGEKLFQGKIWVLVGPQVYSSAESFAVFCKATQFASLVGKTTGGGNTGGPVWLELPNSHMLVTFDVEYALNPDGSCSQEIGTIPDIESEDALKTVLELIGEQQ